MSEKLFSDTKILSKMTKDFLTPAAIAQKVGCSHITISRALPRLFEEGLVEKITIKSVNDKKIVGWYTELNRKTRRK
jgi:predicted transcriptional regulator